MGGYEDLGWNDMGHHEPVAEHVPSPIAALTPAPRQPLPEPVEPPIVEQQRGLAERFEAAEPEPVAEVVEPRAPAPVVSLPKRQKRQAIAPTQNARKAAFTLRLDSDRHYRLRLACAVSGRSAQQIVTVALDEWLKALPEIDNLAARLPAAAQRN